MSPASSFQPIPALTEVQYWVLRPQQLSQAMTCCSHVKVSVDELLVH